MTQPTILVTAPQLAAEAQQRLREAGLQIDFMQEPIDEAALIRRLSLGDVQAVVLRGSKPFTAPVLAAARGLKLIAKNGAGVDSVDLAEAARRGIAVAVAAGANADAVAEHALALMLALVRALPQLDRKLRSGGWEGTAWQGRDFRGAVLGIVGHGAIGRATARLAAALGAQVLVLDRQGRGADGLATVATLDELLPRVDILSLHCPLTEQTRGLIGARELALLKPGALLINTARGPVVDEAALVDALRSGHLGGAGLDTFDIEPLPADHALRGLPQALLTPHVAGVTRNAALRVAMLTAQNVIDVLAGRPLPPAHVIVAPPRPSAPVAAAPVAAPAPSAPPLPSPGSPLAPHPDDPQREVADLPSACVQAHAANLMVLHDGSLACVWFGGSMEGRSDISVYLSRLDEATRRWSAPEQLSHDAERSEQNPILFPVPDGPLWLLHTAQQAGNQDTAVLRRRISHDGGRHWGPSETLDLAPVGSFVRQPLHVHVDGSWLLPIFDCKTLPGQKWDGSLDESAVLRSTDRGACWQRIAVPGSLGCVHMSIVPAADGRLLGFFRSRWADHIHRTHSSDGGLSWAEPMPTVLPNNNSSVQALRLADGRLAMIFNASSAADAQQRRASLYDELEDDGAAPSSASQAASSATTASTAATPARRAFWGAPRAPLTLALSADDGLSWPWQRHLELGDGYCMSNDSARGINREYSYPTLRQTADGALHLAYTVFRRHIRHVRLMPDWITAAADGPSGAG